MSLGKKIKNIRISKNLSQDRFGKKIGVSGKTISSYECERARPTLKVLENITNMYGESFVHITGDGKQHLYQRLKNIQNYISEIESMILDLKD